MTHTEYQGQIVQLAGVLGWKHLHVRRSRGRGNGWTTTTNREGWPDLFLWHRRLGFAAVEVKVKPDLPTQEQLDVLAELAVAGQGAACVVAYPEDFDRLQELLRGRGSAWPYTGRLRSA